MGGLAGKTEAHAIAGLLPWCSEPRVACFGQLHATWYQERYMAGEGGLAAKPLLLESYGPAGPRVAHFGQLHVTWCQEK